MLAGAVALDTAGYGYDHPEVATDLETLAEVQDQLGDHEPAPRAAVAESAYDSRPSDWRSRTEGSGNGLAHIGSAMRRVVRCQQERETLTSSDAGVYFPSLVNELAQAVRQLTPISDLHLVKVPFGDVRNSELERHTVSVLVSPRPTGPFLSSSPAPSEMLTAVPSRRSA